MRPNMLPTLSVDHVKECGFASEGGWPQTGNGLLCPSNHRLGGERLALQQRLSLSSVAGFE